jgi:formate dehydrogenase major subunit
MATTRSRLQQLIATAKEWPLWRQVADLGMGPEAISANTRRLRARVLDADAKAVSVCPYCAVGCSQLIYAREGKVIAVEGNPDSPVNRGTLCPKGAATLQLLNNPNRWTTVKYRAPYGDRWEDKPLDWAMERIARLVKETRDATWQERNAAGQTVRHTTAIASLGGATLDNEENYLIKKLFTGGLGMVWLENQARV